MKIDKVKIINLLAEISEIPITDRPLNLNGSLDLNRFNELPKVLEVKNKLKEMNVNHKWLDKQGFMVASMLLNI